MLAEFCTCGVGFVVLASYISAAQTAFYDEISGRAAEREQEAFAAPDFSDFPGRLS